MRSPSHTQSASGWSPVYSDDMDNLGVMSIGFMLPNPDDAVIWRGPRKNGLIKQFLKVGDECTTRDCVVPYPRDIIIGPCVNLLLKPTYKQS